MIIKIQTFGIARDIVGGHTSFEIEVPNQCTSQQLRDIIFAQYPAFEKLRTLAIAINEDYANGDEVIQASDQIALIPPVSGG